MRKKNYKGRCEKKYVSKCDSICKTYDPIQAAYVDLLDSNPDIDEIKCNVILDGDEAGEYMTDIVCTKSNGELLVRECVSMKILTRPLTGKMLDMSRTYWLRRGVADWGIVVDAAEE